MPLSVICPKDDSPEPTCGACGDFGGWHQDVVINGCDHDTVWVWCDECIVGREMCNSQKPPPPNPVF